MRSDRTRVPPVTPERSPPASRTTGADSPVMADSSTRGDPCDDLAVGRDDLPGVDDDEVAFLEVGGRSRFKGGGRQAEGGVEIRVRTPQSKGRRFLARLAQGVGLGLAAGLGQRLGEVGEQHRQQQPDVQRDQVAERRLVDAGSITLATV